MRIKAGLTLRKMAGEYIIVQPDLGMQDMTNIFTLNATSAYLWEQIIGKDFTKDDLVELLLNKYEVSEEIAKKDVDALISSFRAQNLIID